MAKQALTYIQEVEEESKKLTEQALEDAAQLVADANKKVEADILTAQEKLKAEAKKAKEAAAKKAAAQQEEFEAETKRMCEELGQSLTAKKEKAVTAVMNLIANK